MSLAAALLAATLAASPTVAQLEARAASRVASDYGRVGRRTPVRDPALDAAARVVAQHALEVGARRATEQTALTEAVSFAGGWDASPRALVLKGAPRDAPFGLLEKRNDVASDPATHVGVGVAVDGDASALVLLFARRTASLEPFARKVPQPGPPRELCGRLEAPLQSPEAFVTLPSGAVEQLVAVSHGTEAKRFCFRVRMGETGRHTVEVLGRGPGGPEVAALFFSDVGTTAGGARDQALDDEPSDPAQARARILERINALRKANGAAPLSLDGDASKVAQAYSERMAKEGFFAHVAPDGTNVGQRLSAGGYAFRAAGENLGLASGPLSAHFGIEHSPGHRRNLIDPQYSRVGIGIARRDDGGGEQVILTEVLVDPARASGDPLADAYAAVDGRRKDLKLPSLKRNKVLEELALEHAKRAFALEEPKGTLPGSRLHERVFDALDDVGSASIDVFIADSPSLIGDSKSLRDPGNRWIGVGAVRGDSAKFGKGRYWIVVIYASPRQRG